VQTKKRKTKAGEALVGMKSRGSQLQKGEIVSGALLGENVGVEAAAGVPSQTEHREGYR
jgi:hypothetical protein